MEDTGTFVTLQVNPTEQTAINFYFILVELRQGNTPTFSQPIYTPATDDNPATLSYTVDYGSNPPDGNAPMAAYLLPFKQQFEDPSLQENPINLNGATLYVYEKGKKDPPVKGSVQNVRTTQRPTNLPPDHLFSETALAENEIRYCIAQYTVASTNLIYYFFIGLSLTDKTNHNHDLKLTIKSDKPKTLIADYQAQEGSVNITGGVCAIGFIPNILNQFNEIYLKSIDDTKVTIKYDDEHLVNCNTAKSDHSE